jgi:hypothetical protein
MKERLLTCAGLCLLLSSCAHAQSVTPAPSLLNFQGRLAKPDGTPLPDSTYKVHFSLWNAPTGGIRQWKHDMKVMVRNGVFSTLLDFGDDAETIFGGDVWLETQIGSDPPLTPRQRVVSVAYALKATTVPDEAITTAKLADFAVATAKLASGAITGSKIANFAITGIKLANLSITTAKLADGSVTTPKLADRSVTLAKLAVDVPFAHPSRYLCLVWDDFNRPDGQIGRTPNGFAWGVSGMGSFVIRGNKLVNQPFRTAYAHVDVTEIIQRMEAEWTFEPGTDGATVGIITGRDSTTLLSSNVHVICRAESFSVQVYWNGEVHNWEGNQCIFPAPLARDGKTVHKLSYEVVGDTVHVALSNGIRFSTSDPRIAQCTGKRAIIEIHSMTQGRAEPRFVGFAAFSRNNMAAPAATLTPQDVAGMISASNALRSPSIQFTPASPGWYRIARGGSQMLGVCHISSRSLYLGSSPVDAQFGYTCNNSVAQPGSLFNVLGGSINAPSLAEIRVSNGTGECYLDIRVTAGGTPLEIALTGLNPGNLLSTPEFQPAVGIQPVTYTFR